MDAKHYARQIPEIGGVWLEGKPMCTTGCPLRAAEEAGYLECRFWEEPHLCRDGCECVPLSLFAGYVDAFDV